MAVPDFDTTIQLYRTWSKRGASEQEIQNAIALQQGGGGSTGNITASSTPLVRYENPVGTFGFGLYDGDTNQITPIGGGAAFTATAANVVSEEDFEVELIRVAVADTARGTDYDIGDTVAQFLLRDNSGNTSTYWRNVDPDEDNIIPAPDKTHLAAATSASINNPLVLPYRYSVGAGPEIEGRLRIYFDTSVSPPVLLNQEIVDLTGAVVPGATPLGYPGSQAELITRLGNINDPASEANGLIALLKTILAQMRDDRSLAPQIWTDDTGTFFDRVASYNDGTGQYEFSYSNPTTGADYTPGTNPRPAQDDPDKDVVFVPVLYDEGANTGLNGFQERVYDYATNPPTVTTLGVLDTAYATVATATNVRERPLDPSTAAIAATVGNGNDSLTADTISGFLQRLLTFASATDNKTQNIVNSVGGTRIDVVAVRGALGSAADDETVSSVIGLLKVLKEASTPPVEGTVTEINNNFPSTNPAPFTLLTAGANDVEILGLDWSVNRNCIIRMLFGTVGKSRLRNVRAFEKSYGDRALVLPAGQALIFEKSGTNNTVLFTGSIITRELV